jgi:tetratricopeptide (TPR) repeat protein
MVVEATAFIPRTRNIQGVPGSARGTGLEMKLSRRSTSVPDRTSSWLVRSLVLVLVVGILAFAGFYYQDQHVDAGPSLVDRQITSIEQAVRKTPNNISARLQLASVYRADKRLDDALKQYDEILKADAKNRTALLGRAAVLMAKGDLKGAAVVYHKITGAAVKGEFAAQDPQLEEAYYFLGSIALKQGKTKEAITQLQTALQIDRADSDALYLLGNAWLKDGKPKFAVEALKQALLFVPTGWCEPHTQLALAYGKLAQAPQATYAGAMADFCHKKPAEAQRRLKTLTTGPVKVEAMLGLGLIAETASNNAEAISWYKKALTVDPANVDAISSLSRLGVGPTDRPTSSPTTQGPS